MSRIRTIKPEFTQSESIGRLSRDARLLFILMWTMADDLGRLRAASRVLAGQLYPFDEDAPALIDTWIEELQHEGCLTRYVVDGSVYIQIDKWLKHQRIDHPSASRLPESSRALANPRESSRALANPRESSRALATDLGPRTLDLGPRTLDLGPRTLDLGSRTLDLGSKNPPTPRSRGGSADEPEWAAHFMSSYPKRAGDQRWKDATRSANARIKEGHTPIEFIDGAQRYAAYIEATDRVGTQYVMAASTFLGPGKPFMQPWDPPSGKAERRLGKNVEVAHEFINRTEGNKNGN